jgi:hypothetical protein
MGPSQPPHHKNLMEGGEPNASAGPPGAPPQTASKGTTSPEEVCVSHALASKALRAAGEPTEGPKS